MNIGITQEVIPLVQEHVAHPGADERADHAVDDEVAGVLLGTPSALDLPVEEPVAAQEYAYVKQAVVADPVPRERHPARVMDEDGIDVPGELLGRKLHSMAPTRG